MVSLTKEQLLELARVGAENIASDIPDKVDPASVSISTPIPFRALLIRTVMRARMAEITQVAYDLFANDKRVSGFIMARVAIENVALINGINDRMLRALNEKKVGDSGDYLNQLGWGSRTNITPDHAINILTLISKLHTKYDKFHVQDQYDDLSEIAHPNWGGLLGSYGGFDNENLYGLIDEKGTLLPVVLGLHALVTAHELFEKAYNETVELLPGFVILCESELENDGD